MKKTNLYFLIICLFFVACQEKKQESSEKKPSTVEAPKEEVEKLSVDEYSQIFIAIMKTDKGMARGVKIGDNIDTINETADIADSQVENGKSYTSSFDDMGANFVDIEYIANDERKITSIVLDVYLENESSVDSLFNEFNLYFKKKYGQGKAQKKEITWNLTDGVNQLLLQNISKEKDPGLKIVFAKKGDKPLL